MNETDKSQISDGYHTFEELYEHRHALFLNLLNNFTHMAWASKVHSDGTSWDGWFIAGMDTPTGQISYHLPDRFWPIVDEMGITFEKAPAWDGHNSNDVIDRLMDWVRRD